MTPAQTVMAIVEANAKRTKRAIPAVWDSLYAQFEYRVNVSIRRLANNSGRTGLHVAEQEGLLLKLVEFAREFLGEKPALPEQKKTPWQGSLMEEERV